MSTPKAAFTQAELRRYLRATRAAGYDDWRIEIAKPDDTRVSIVSGKAGGAAVDDLDAMIEGLP